MTRTHGGHTTAVAPDATIQEVADGVFAYVQLPGGWCLSNAGVITGAQGATVVDTLATEKRARQLKDFVVRVSPGPERVLVNTHHHGDHTFGNQVFGSVPIIAHDRARSEMASTGLALTQLWPQVDWGQISVVLPSVTFPHRLSIHMEDRRIELLHVGPAHTTNDVVVWLPDERVLFAGDVVLSGSTPFMLMGSISGALSAVEVLRALGAVTVVCGHGPVTGSHVFDETMAYLTWIRQLAEEGQRRGLTPLEAALEADLADFGHLVDPERIVGNLHRAYAEQAGAAWGASIDVATAFSEMVSYNGGRLPECLA